MSKKKKAKHGLPKKIGGVKIPKSVRKGPLGAFLASTAGQALVADLVLMAGAAMVGRKALSGGEARAPETAELTSSRLTEAFQAGVQAFTETLQLPSEQITSH